MAETNCESNVNDEQNTFLCRGVTGVGVCYTFIKFIKIIEPLNEKTGPVAKETEYLKVSQTCLALFSLMHIGTLLMHIV
jgi:hypothetical protein